MNSQKITITLDSEGLNRYLSKFIGLETINSITEETYILELLTL